MAYDISEEKRAWYRDVSRRSRLRKASATNGELPHEPGSVNVPAFAPERLMSIRSPNGIRALSLFAGGGGLDLAFDRAGFGHVGSFDILDICGDTLRRNRTDWRVLSGTEGDVTLADWTPYRGSVDVIHGGPPCQPFSIAGRRAGEGDARNMWPAFVAAVLAIQPRAFLAENVPGLLSPRFSRYVEEAILAPLAGAYRIRAFSLLASDFGVPQVRKRVFFVGFSDPNEHDDFAVPEPTHRMDLLTQTSNAMGARAALGLPDIGFDCAAPTLRSGFTGPRKTTSILNSKASLDVWSKLRIWPNGVQRDRDAAVRFPPENGHFRLSVQDCAVLQGFPEDWTFCGATYQILGQIGNSVCPPVGYEVASAMAKALTT